MRVEDLERVERVREKRLVFSDALQYDEIDSAMRLLVSEVERLWALLQGDDCQDCRAISTLSAPIAMVVKTNHHGGYKRVCEERGQCHQRRSA